MCGQQRQYSGHHSNKQPLCTKEQQNVKAFIRKSYMRGETEGRMGIAELVKNSQGGM